jgi:uncharacterized protein YdhG (YjbR/CyaY superfamily)
MNKNAVPTSVESYIKDFPEEVKTRLESMRTVVKKAAPEAEESMSYGVAAYKYNGRPLVYFGGFKRHVSLFAVTNSGLEKFANELKPYKMSKGTIQFQHDEPLPLTLIKKIVKFRLEENKAPMR